MRFLDEQGRLLGWHWLFNGKWSLTVFRRWPFVVVGIGRHLLRFP